jgi:hypothetical protein
MTQQKKNLINNNIEIVIRPFFSFDSTSLLPEYFKSISAIIVIMKMTRSRTVKNRVIRLSEKQDLEVLPILDYNAIKPTIINN